MPLQQWWYVRNDGPDREYMHHGFRRFPAQAVLMAPGIVVPIVNGRITWPHGAIICVDRIVWTTSPALGKYPWSVEVTQDEFVALLRESISVPPAIEPEVTETPAPAIDPDETIAGPPAEPEDETPVEESEPEAEVG